MSGLAFLGRLKRRLAVRSNARWALGRLRKTRFGIEVLRNRYLDYRYGGDGSRIKISRYSDFGANNVQSSYYSLLSSVFASVPIRESDVLVDVGCAWGRVIHYWLSLGCRNRMVGIELDPEVAAETAERLRPYPNVTIVAGNALDNIPRDGTIFYLYNPFGREVWEQFKARMEEMFLDKGNIVLVYTNCSHIDAFETSPRWEVQHLATSSSGPAAIVRMASSRNVIVPRP